MQDAQNELDQGEDLQLGGDVMESLGLSPDDADVTSETPTPDELPPHIKERLGRQEKRHKKEMRNMESRLNSMQQQFSNPHSFPDDNSQQMAPYPANPNFVPGSEDERIHKAVSHALNMKDMQEKQKRDAERIGHVHKQYQTLQDHLDDVANNYDDFEDVVRAPDAPFTEAMRDAALLIPNAGEVLYKLGKNKDELKRISALHPLEQAKEMVKLSIALMGGANKASNAPKTPMGQIKSNPVNSSSVNDKTSVSEIRRRLKSNWK